MKKVGILTGGGDAPGLNAVIRGAVTRLAHDKTNEWKCIGFVDGWAGLRDDHKVDLSMESVGEIIYEGGTILGTSRTNLYKKPEDVTRALGVWKRHELDALIAIGGDDTLEIAYYLSRDHKLNVVGVPKTIDNDVNGTDFTFGFWSSVEQATRAIDALRSTTMSHHRIMVVECMGRHAGWIGAYSGMASAADYIAVPEKPVDIQEICDVLKRVRASGKSHSIVVVTEGSKISGIEVAPHVVKDGTGRWTLSAEAQYDSFKNVILQPGQVGEAVAAELQKRTSFEARAIALGHLQRGGSPAAYDRILGTRYGVSAAEAVVQNKFGHMVRLNGLEVEVIPMKGLIRETQEEKKKYKLLPTSFMDMASIFWTK
ncbi:MAG TPA: ATP-dependent 6-phosphofructokinase [Planctomycetota bacterium]|nr:ATP-dependent 6-phosphofructokinase [Planctomycetota bacterium]